MYIKKITLGLLLCLINSYLLPAQDKNEYTIKGILPDSIDNVYVYLTPVKVSNDLAFEDSAIVRKGQFSFNGIAGIQKNMYSIRSNEYPEIGGWVVIEPGTISYYYQENDGIKYGYAKGSYLNDLLTDSILIPSVKIAKFGEMLISGTVDKESAEMVKLMNEMRGQALTFRNDLLSFIRQNVNNGAGEYIFSLYGVAFAEEEINDILPNLSENTRQKYLERKGIVSKISLGQQYIPFRGKTLNGEYINIVDIINQEKFVLLDFWASWCVPCIKEMPVITQLYNDYLDKGLKIVSISMDENELSWKKAVEKNKMSWLQIISKKGGSDDIAELYGIQAIPHTILINSKGEVIAINLRGTDLVEKIRNILE